MTESTQVTLTIPALSVGSNAGVSVDGGHEGGASGFLGVHSPGLYRLRSNGPPPYVLLSRANAPPLPPSFSTVRVNEEAGQESEQETPIEPVPEAASAAAVGTLSLAETAMGAPNAAP